MSLEGINDYENRPVPGPVLNDPAKYTELRQQLQTEFANNVNVLQIVANVTSLVDQVVSYFTRVSPLQLSRMIYAGDVSGAVAYLNQAGGSDAASTQVRNPATGSTCPFSQALSDVVAGIGSEARSSLGGIVSRFLAGH